MRAPPLRGATVCGACAHSRQTPVRVRSTWTFPTSCGAAPSRQATVFHALWCAACACATPVRVGLLGNERENSTSDGRVQETAMGGRVWSLRQGPRRGSLPAPGGYGVVSTTATAIPAPRAAQHRRGDWEAWRPGLRAAEAPVGTGRLPAAGGSCPSLDPHGSGMRNGWGVEPQATRAAARIDTPPPHTGHNQRALLYCVGAFKSREKIIFR
jgi:hypothetical protein